MTATADRTMMGRLAMLMNKSENLARKRKRSEQPATGAGNEDEEGGKPEQLKNGVERATAAVTAEGKRSQLKQREPSGVGSGNGTGGGGGETEGGMEVEVAKTGTAMREVAVASAPADAAAAEISAMLRGRKRKKKKAIEEAFAGEYVPMDPLDWRARGR